MSHAQTGWRTDSESLLSDGCSSDWVHTANAATVTSRETACDLSAWLIAAIEPCADRKDTFNNEKKM